MSVYVGIDVHRKRSQVAVIDARGEVLANRNVPNGAEPILKVIGGLPPGTPAASGAAFGTGWLVELLQGYGFDPHLVHPLRCKAIASARLKNDKVDAALGTATLLATSTAAFAAPHTPVTDVQHLCLEWPRTSRGPFRRHRECCEHQDGLSGHQRPGPQHQRPDRRRHGQQHSAADLARRRGDGDGFDRPPGHHASPVPARQPSMRPGRYWIFFRPCRMTWTRWPKLASSRTPVRTGQPGRQSTSRSGSGHRADISTRLKPARYRFPAEPAGWTGRPPTVSTAPERARPAVANTGWPSRPIPGFSSSLSEASVQNCGLGI
jgi:Transposase